MGETRREKENGALRVSIDGKPFFTYRYDTGNPELPRPVNARNTGGNLPSATQHHSGTFAASPSPDRPVAPVRHRV